MLRLRLVKGVQPNSRQSDGYIVRNIFFQIFIAISDFVWVDDIIQNGLSLMKINPKTKYILKSHTILFVHASATTGMTSKLNRFI